MKQATGVPSNITEPILAKVAIKPRGLFRRKGYVLVGDHLPQKGYAACLTPGVLSPNFTGVSQLPSNFLQDELRESDLVLITKDGKVSVLWEAGSSQNGLLLTEACDCRCLMCPQPPKKHDSSLLALSRQVIDRVLPSEIQSICLTGGEPTLLQDQFVDLLVHINAKLPNTPIFVLTNAKNFANFDFAKRCAMSSKGQVQYCVSLHADNDLDHDRIVGIPGSFQKTILGITNLARLKMPIEIRFVINRINVDRMAAFADFVYRNFPFAVHVAFMTMEVRGLAVENMEVVWIDPVDYGEKVRFAANRLRMRGMSVSIYNMPLCLLPRTGWPFARQSISGWKNDFLPQCRECSVQNQCAGIFTSSYRQSDYIHPIKS